MLKNVLENHWFWKYTIKEGKLLNSEIEAVNNKIKFSQTVFYILLFIKLTYMMYGFNEYLGLDIIDPLWPVIWVKFLPVMPWVVIFIAMCFVLSLSSIVFGLTKYLKISLFFTCFILFSLLNSRGKINHSYHTILIPLFCFIFLDNSKSKTYENFTIFATSVFALLMSYFLAGFWKITKAFHYLYKGEKGLFDIDAFTRMLKYQFRYDEPTALAKWIIEHENIGYLMIWSGVLLEFFSILVFFFGKGHKFWGAALLLLHISISIIMDVSFSNAFITLIPLLVLSPFSVKKEAF